MIHNVRVVLILVGVLLLSGCGTMNKAAFDGTKRFALVSIACNDTIGVNGGNPNGAGATSVLGMVQSIGSDVGFSEEAAPVFKEILPDIKRAFRKNGHYKLLSERKVLRSRAYKNMKGADPDGIFVDMILANGYKLFEDKDQLAQLAKELKVDGVIAVRVGLGYAFSGLNLAGLVSAGAHNAKVMYSVVVVDPDGNTLWADNYEIESDESVAALGEAVNFPKLRPYLVATAKKGIKETLAKLDE